ncbi:MAG: hypothetical protein PF447_12025 [Spirochaetaceae bacterium]|nr:hypothetical protein [Spirochaetaceae bacterium]
MNINDLLSLLGCFEVRGDLFSLEKVQYLSEHLYRQHPHSLWLMGIIYQIRWSSGISSGSWEAFLLTNV